MDYKIQRYKAQLLEVNSDSFLSTTPQKLNIFLSSFFPQGKEKIKEICASFSAFNPTNLYMSLYLQVGHSKL